MAFYTEVIFSTEYLTLKSFKESVPGQPVLLDDLVLKTESFQSSLKARTKHFPRVLKIFLEPEELIFKNISLPLQNEKLLDQAVQFENRKYFRISEAEFDFTTSVWKKDESGIHVTLLGAGRESLEKYRPFIQAGFIPQFMGKGFLSVERGTVLRLKNMDEKNESLQLFHNGSLIAWKVYRKENAAEAKAKILEYMKSLGLSLPEGAKLISDGVFHDKCLSFNSGTFQGLTKTSMKRQFNQLTVAFAVILACLFLVSNLVQLSIKRDNLKQLDTLVEKLKNQYQISDLKSLKKKSDVKGAELSRVLYNVGKLFPHDRKVSRFEYNNGEVALTVRDADVLKANEIKEALETGKGFSMFRIEEGAVSNEERIIFQNK